MKRYRNLAIIAVVTSISLGTFYTNVALSESKLPKFYLKTEKGDSKYAKNIVINAGYGSDGNRSLNITTDGSDYKNNRSFFGDFNRDYFELKKLNNLQKEERNYMRGKNSSSQFYVDKDFVWHAEVKGGKFGGGYEHTNNHFKMYIDGLDRQNTDRYTFKLDIPEEENYSYIYVDDVQLIGKELVVTTFQNKTNLMKDKNTNSDVYVDSNEQIMYRINVSQRKIVDRTVINKSNNDEKIHTDIQSSIQEADRTASSKYYIYKEVKLKDKLQPNGETTSEEVSNELIVFNLESGKEEVLNLSKDQKEQVKQSNVLLDNNDLYFLTHGETGLSILKYSLNNKKIEGQPVVISKKIGGDSNYKVLDGKLYAITNSLNSAKRNNEFIIADLSNGQIIYEGKMEVKNSKGNSNKFIKELQLFDFTNE